mmetsp:Transcript_68684/g.119304  ORF Transcript_68684/g.119304 Transcript_68684/m.119304 type:complete len:270 (-) Transcript_68684:91-900(-)
MWWLIAVAGAFFFRGQIAKFLAPLLPDLAPQKVAFYGNAVTLFAGIAYIIPVELVGLGILKRPCYIASMWTTILTAIFNLKSNYGSPNIPQDINFSNWREKMVAVQPWLMQVISSVDFHFLFFALIFLAAYPTVWVLVILCRRSLWTVCTAMAKNSPENPIWKRFAPTWEKLKAKNDQVLEYSALAEVMLAIWLSVSLFLPMRQIVTCILYWHYLKIRYQAQRSHPQHLKAWMMLGKQVDPVTKMVPILEKPIGWAKDWFRPQVVYRQQ